MCDSLRGCTNAHSPSDSRSDAALARPRHMGQREPELLP